MFVCGQPLGFYSSWLLFTLSHHVILWLAANRVYPKRRFRDYGILGDDVVIADHKVAVEYRKILTDLGVMISGSKSLVSQTGAAKFSKRFKVKRGLVDASPVSMRLLLMCRSNLGLASVKDKYNLDMKILFRLAWDYLWASIPNLVFEQSLPAKRTLLMNFVDRALCLRDSSDIKQFTLRCDVLCDAPRINTWISAVVRHNVQELCIELDNFEGVFSLPYCLFTCKTLTSLRLEMPYMLKLPTTICFSNLKILTICKVTFSDECLTQQLFSGLPVLENFTLFNCSWGGLKSVSISAPKLRSLSILETEIPDDDFWSYSDVCQVMIAGDSLKNFYYMGLLCSDYCIYKSFSLESAHIDTNDDYISDHDYIPNEITHGLYKLLIGLSNVKSLRLSSYVVEVLINAEELLPHMPMFNNLMDLVFQGSLIDLDSATLLKILQNSPCLERLQFLGGFNLPLNYEEEDRILDPVPQCFLSHLKWIGVNSYQVNQELLSALTIFLNKAVVLENIVIFLLGNDLVGNLERRDEACEQLMELPAGPQNCKIVLEWFESFPNRWRIVLD